MTDQQVIAPTLGEAIQRIDVLALQAADDGRGDAAGAFAAASYIIRESVRGISQPCETCGGSGTIHLDHEVLADINVECPDCKGWGYRYTGGLVERILERLRTEQTFGLLDALSAEIGPNPEDTP